MPSPPVKGGHPMMPSSPSNSKHLAADYTPEVAITISTPDDLRTAWSRDRDAALGPRVGSKHSSNKVEFENSDLQSSHSHTTVPMEPSAGRADERLGHFRMGMSQDEAQSSSRFPNHSQMQDGQRHDFGPNMPNTKDAPDRLEIDSQAPVPEDDDESIAGTFRETHLEKVPFKGDPGGKFHETPAGVWEDTPQEDTSGETTNADGSSNNRTLATPQSGNSRGTWRSNLSSKLSSVSSRAYRGVSKVASLVKGDGSPIDPDAKMIRKWVFKTVGRDRELLLSHAQGIWYIKVDSEFIATRTHNNSAMKRFSTSIEFPVPLTDEECGILGSVTGKMTMEWVPRSVRWFYTLTLNGLSMQACWSKATGLIEGIQTYEIGRGAVLPALPEGAVGVSPDSENPHQVVGGGVQMEMEDESNPLGLPESPEQPLSAIEIDPGHAINFMDREGNSAVILMEEGRAAESDWSRSRSRDERGDDDYETGVCGEYDGMVGQDFEVGGTETPQLSSRTGLGGDPNGYSLGAPYMTA